MRALNRKLWRELWAMRGQGLAIALVIVSGVAVYIMSISTLDSLYLTREHYYQNQRFAEVFASLKRAPESLAKRIAEIPGVESVETRVVANINLKVEGFSDPITGRLLSIPDHGRAQLNQIFLRQGRMFEPGRSDEIVLSEAFAKAHGLGPGDSLIGLINGRYKRLHIVGIALSPEYIYQIAPGAWLPDFKRYGVLWMGRSPLAEAYDMDGAFNNVVLTLGHAASLQAVIERLDVLIKPYGGFGAYERKFQFSHRFLNEELKQLKAMAALFPVIFLGVAAFLLNVVVSRLISTQREQVAVLKAFGYSVRSIAVHFMSLILIIVLLGAAGGIALGVWLGLSLSHVYMEFYRFPYLNFVLREEVVLAAIAISAAAAILGTLHAVLRAAREPPAQAMRPEPPQHYRATLIERSGLQGWFSQPSRMILRHIERRPLKSLLSVIGIAFACGIMMVGRFQEDAINYMVDVQFRLAQQDDLTVHFIDPTPARALYSLRDLAGVRHTEGFRRVPTRLHFQQRSYRLSLQGVEPEGELMRVLDTELRRIQLPNVEGIVLSQHLGKILGIRPGEYLTVEVLEGERPTLQLPVLALSKQYLGVGAYLPRRILNRLMREGDVISGAYLAIEQHQQAAIFAALQETPRVLNTVVRKTSVQSFYTTMAETILFFTFVATLLGSVIAFGVVYNSARIALSERARELASLRVLGLTRGEVAYILLGELALLTLAAIPLGFLIGQALCAYLAGNLQTDLYRVPLVLEIDTYAFAAAVVLVSSLVSGYLIWRQIEHLDMVAVLKTKE